MEFTANLSKFSQMATMIVGAMFALKIYKVRFFAFFPVAMPKRVNLVLILLGSCLIRIIALNAAVQ